MSIRKVNLSLKSKATLEGAGVRLRRAFGYVDESLDPFLLLWVKILSRRKDSACSCFIAKQNLRLHFDND